jgi:RimJ/RimL family protein N-acetyltransferase
MYLWLSAQVGEMVFRPLIGADRRLVVEATTNEVSPAIWGPRPSGPYTLADADRALTDWDPSAGQRATYGLIQEGRLVAVAGLMLEAPPDSAEVAYWVPPQVRRRGLGHTAVTTLTASAHTQLGIPRLWLEIDPTNEASLRLARGAGYEFEQRLPMHCRSWLHDDPVRDIWHDCLIWTHTARQTS